MKKLSPRRSHSPDEKKLRISKTLALPDEFITSTQGILAKKGKGKTYTAMLEAEQLLGAHQQVVALDPTGAWWGLRSSANGSSPGFRLRSLGLIDYPNPGAAVATPALFIGGA